MTALPLAIPVTTPVSEPMLAIAGALLRHVPPDVVLASVVVAPVHNAVAPVIALSEMPVTVIDFVATAEPHPFTTV